MKTLLKWAGGKKQLYKEIEKRLPDGFNNYIEPFFGGGAVFFELAPANAIINDMNVELINCYNQVRNNLDFVIVELDKLQNEHNQASNQDEYYYYIRDLFNSRRFSVLLNYVDAAMMIYLNKAGFNGMYRENKSGFFNIPSGKKKTVKLYERDNLIQCSKQLEKAEIFQGDFERVCLMAQEGDFVFIDSPYYDTFDTYQAGGFSEEDHIRLAEVFRLLTERGVKCMLTNSDKQFIKDLYRDYNIEVVNVTRMIGFKNIRKKETEIIVTNY